MVKGTPFRTPTKFLEFNTLAHNPENPGKVLRVKSAIRKALRVEGHLVSSLRIADLGSRLAG